MNKRLLELDFLRGIAIILVILRHQHLTVATETMGWIGVDLFFVLSGFLVSGLLFKEFSATGKIRPKVFLIRRGFKIYPIYYLSYFLYIIPIILRGQLNIEGLLGDLFFLQNYITGFGFAYNASWSLAVEEHFYFFLAFLLFVIASRNPKMFAPKTLSGFESLTLLLMTTCFLTRIITNIYTPANVEFNFTNTHLRIDSLLAGVFVSYNYHFKRESFTRAMHKWRYIIPLVIVAGLCWTPFIEPLPSFFAKTFGFTLIYISFALLLSLFVTTPDIVSKLYRIFSRPVVNSIGRIGFASYSIYIIHAKVIAFVHVITSMLNLVLPDTLTFLIVLSLSVFAGVVMTYTVEAYFLRLREKFYPGVKKSSLYASVST